MTTHIPTAAVHAEALLQVIKRPVILDLLEVLQAISVILAAGAALWWFWARRERAPKANMGHSVKFVNLGNNTVYVGVTVSVRNKGRVAVIPKIDSTNNTSMVVIEELSPYLKNELESQEESPEYKMKLLGARTFPRSIHVEAGETQDLLFEFIIQKATKVIKVYSHLENSYNNGKGWDKTTVHEALL